MLIKTFKDKLKIIKDKDIVSRRTDDSVKHPQSPPVAPKMLEFAIFVTTPRQITMRIWHWKSHWKVQPHWNNSETPLKIFTKINHTEIIIFLITLKFVCYCNSRMSILYNPTENFQHYSYALFSQFSALLCFFRVIFSAIFS